MADKPLSVEFWFSLGHSTIVFVLSFLLSVGVQALAGPVEDDSSVLHSVTGVVGASVSGLFLWVLGLINLVVLSGIMRVVRELRAGRYDEAELQVQLYKRGFMNRFLGRLTRAVRKPWHTGTDRPRSRAERSPSGCLMVLGLAPELGQPHHVAAAQSAGSAAVRRDLAAVCS